MNTRLQVEHPVTEMITGQDLVEMQIHVRNYFKIFKLNFQAAAGNILSMKQKDFYINGHAIEARIYAEIPEKDFVPDTGNLRFFKFPENSSDLRIETGVIKGIFLFLFRTNDIITFR